LREAAEERLAGRPWWRPQSQKALPEDPKEALRELTLQLRKAATVPISWAECIRQVSDTEVEVNPRLPNISATDRGAHHGGAEDRVGPSEEGQEQEHEEVQRPRGVPKLAAVPLALGSLPGERMTAMVRLQAQRTSHIGEAIMLGVEFVSVVNGQGMSTSVYFAPVSGRVFVNFPAEPDGLVAEAMPGLSSSLVAEVEAFLSVSASGCMSFGRRCDGRGPVEWCGEVPAEFLPARSAERYPSLVFQVDQLEEPARISVVSAGPELPASVVPGAVPAGVFDAVWSVHTW